MKRRVRSRSGKLLGDRKISSPNAYLMAVFTAGMAAIFSMIGGCLLAHQQSKQVAVHRLHERRLAAYEMFVQRVGVIPGVSEVLSSGAMVSDLITDSELELFEYRSAELLKAHHTQDLYWRLSAEMQVLRLHGTPQVRDICDDILRLLLMRHEAVRWDRYSPRLRAFYFRSRSAQEVRTAYGMTEQVTEDERLMIIMAPQLMQVLVDRLRAELHRTSN